MEHARKHIDDYPLMLTAEELKEILQVSKVTAYSIMDQPSFPLIRIGRSKRVLKKEFLTWLTKQQSNKL
ncbi:DNA-binding protein [Bacillus sp. HMF5848]|uniref:helix-turn-helix domain-containing protein n=1 Tax=Bacillus sp. HMF5848 TaxID=2495421 RepID=UPI000F79C140|nr:helix-turn-helix domain-containing protein [Bacillus sp. HMF5848]RSK26536.1 DNA-binding protein [Bacillus sp. HMF5848]